jgi:hypothetical protein
LSNGKASGAHLLIIVCPAAGGVIGTYYQVIMLRWRECMKPFCLPVNHLELFKALANATIDQLPEIEQLRGSRLYNVFSQPLGYSNYNALKESAKYRGAGDLDARTFLNLLEDVDIKDESVISIEDILWQAADDLKEKFPELWSGLKTEWQLQIDAIVDKIKVEQPDQKNYLIEEITNEVFIRMRPGNKIPWILISHYVGRNQLELGVAVRLFR